MTVSSTTDRATFPGNGVAQIFPLPFRFFENSDIQVWLITNATGVLIPQTLGVHYTLTGANDPEIDGSPTSALTMLLAPSALQSLFVRRTVPLTQPTDIINQGRFFPETHETVFDRLTMLCQQAIGESQGAIRVAIGDPEPARLPPAVSRASLLLGFDANGDPVPVAPVSGSAADLALLLANSTDPDKGAGAVGFARSPMSKAITTVGGYLSSSWVSLWEFAAHVVTKPDPLDPSTWDWSPALQAAINWFPLNPADPLIHTPKGFANGGCLHIPRGRYPLYSKVTLQRGVRITGDSRESTQLVSFIAADSVLQYLDTGRYLQDELVIENLSIWQDPSVVATAGAAIDVIEGPALIDSVYLKVDNVIIEGTWHGIRLAAGVGCSISNSNVSKCGFHGFWQTGAVSTTSTVLSNTYFHQCGNNGVQIDGGAYVGLIGVASDSNVGSGYKITGKAVHLVACGAEANGAFGASVTGSGSVSIGLFTIANASHGINVVTSSQVTLIGCDLNGIAGFGVSHDGSARITSIGTTWSGAYASSKFSTTTNVLELGAPGGLVGGQTNNWAIGVIQQPETDTTFTVGGNAAAATRNGFKAAAVHTGSGSRNTAAWSQFISANTAVTYSLGIGMFVPNASKGAAATHERTAGVYIVEQTTGVAANANLMIDAGVGTVPAGGWAIYSDSVRNSYLKGPLSWALPATATPAANNDVTFERTSNTTLTVKLRGTDGVVRSVALTLA